MSEPRDWLFRIQDMIENIELIEETLNDKTKRDFEGDIILRRAIERSFEIIGEAARFIPKHIQEKYASIDWANIIGMRHKIAHDYLDIDTSVLWDVYESDFYGLKNELEILLKQEDQ